MRVGGIAVVFSLAGCWVEQVEFTTDVVWSDDATEVAFTVKWHEVPRRQLDEAESDQGSRNRAYQLFRVPRDLSEEPIALGGRRSGIGTLYYIRTAGYVLIEEGHGDAIQVVAVGLDGDERIIEDSDSWPLTSDGGEDRSFGVGGVPSPDGRFVALASSTRVDTEEANPPIETTSYKVVAIGDPETELAALELAGEGGEVWRPDGAFIAYNDDEALEWREGASSFVATTRPPCSWPDTTSSRTSADGTIVNTGIDFDTPFVIDNDDPGVSGLPNIPFGCGG